MVHAAAPVRREAGAPRTRGLHDGLTPAREPHIKARMTRWSTMARWCVSGGIPGRSFKVAVIVGSILNLINQGDALFGDAEVNVAKLLLTFAVPYLVATYGAVAYRLDLERLREP